MIPKAKEFKLIAMYFYISDIYDKELKYSCQRFSNNSEPDFTDQEIMTIYLSRNNSNSPALHKMTLICLNRHGVESKAGFSLAIKFIMTLNIFSGQKITKMHLC
jgi:hypothetical protein